MNKTAAKSKATTPPQRERDPLVWPSVSNFRNQLIEEHESEREGDAPEYLGRSPRMTLRVPIIKALHRLEEPVDSVELRKAVCRDCGLDPESARIINLYAWALVDMKQSGFVLSRKEKGKTFYRLHTAVAATLTLLSWQEVWEALDKKASVT